MENRQLAAVLSDIADLLEIQQANPFRVRAYRRAAQVVADETRPIRERLEAGEDLKELPGVGKDIAALLAELVHSGRAEVLEELEREIPKGLLDLLRLPAVGPKRARKLWEELGITSREELLAAARQGKVAGVEGFGAKTQRKILDSLEHERQRERRWKLVEAESLLAPLLEHLRGGAGGAGAGPLERLEAGGSYRRRRDTVGDLDLLAVAADAGPVMRRFVTAPGVEHVESQGETRATVRLTGGLQVDLRVVPRRSFGAAWVYFTGNKEHNVALRQRAIERGLRLSEYGLFRGGDVEAEGPFAGKLVAGKEEKQIYAALDLPWIPPELREHRGEIAAAARGELPKLVELADLKGDLQMHSTFSDGKNTIEEMARACLARGYEYLALTDHSPALAMIRGLDARKLRLQWKEIAAVQKKVPALTILRSLEVDIHADGTLDMDDGSLSELDLVVASVHSRFELPHEEQTRRILRAIEHPEVDILAHPTGRRIGLRDEMAFDLDAVLRRAAELGVAVEINAHPDRLDLKDTSVMRARELGVKLVISTDAHRIEHLANLRFGVDVARRGWLRKADVLNTLPLERLRRALRGAGRRSGA